MRWTSSTLDASCRLASPSICGGSQLLCCSSLEGVRPALQALSDELPQPAEVTESGFFVRMSHCSPKDADNGDLKPVNNIREALIKIISSKRTVQSLLSLCTAVACDVDSKIFLFTYAKIDKLSEWRCFIHNDRVVAISQTRFHCHNYDLSDESLRRLVEQARLSWRDISPTLGFTSCALDVYAKARNSEFDLRLIEINPGGPHLGSGSLLFHWLDDRATLQPGVFEHTVVRVVPPHSPQSPGEPQLVRNEGYQIGWAGIIQDELKCIRDRGLESILDVTNHDRFMNIRVPGADLEWHLTTRKAALSSFEVNFGGSATRDVTERTGGNHPRFVKLQKAWSESIKG
ncbi:uncharacterized protein JN550_010372 [Neoarthrinium moseri]|uniref:uncharacterized protein n=1 Tax=Neoarthrinium moseri TaxID=1658444 RepID=UPI001FDC3496|nr:uncharacterized protein JN550_010372 [Neoarthrinium moseri]KAI1862216.1 hypothetical protein JN550_010372 [Neoarthrinium moseri]